jgi:hypothetical protein
MISGKGIYIWQGGWCGPDRKGNNSPQVAADVCVLAGISWLKIKIGDATSNYSQSYANMKAAVAAFRAAGISVWLWHYIYGGVQMDDAGNVLRTNGPSPEAEAEYAKRAVDELSPDGYVIDAEKEFSKAQQFKRAARFMTALSGIGVPVGLAGWRFPKLHLDYPWAEFLAGCDYHMPQMYWNQPSWMRPSFGPEAELRTCVRDLLTLKQMPVIPTGRAFIGDGHTGPKPEELTTFLKTAVELHCPAVDFWALDFLYRHTGGKDRLAAISKYQWAGSPNPGPNPDPNPGPGEGSKLIVVSYNLRVRVSPGMDARTIRWLWKGNQVKALQVRDLGGLGTWAEVADGEWAAVAWQGRRYMELVQS